MTIHSFKFTDIWKALLFFQEIFINNNLTSDLFPLASSTYNSFFYDTGVTEAINKATQTEPTCVKFCLNSFTLASDSHCYWPEDYMYSTHVLLMEQLVQLQVVAVHVPHVYSNDI